MIKKIKGGQTHYWTGVLAQLQQGLSATTYTAYGPSYQTYTRASLMTRQFSSKKHLSISLTQNTSDFDNYTASVYL